jgi:capsular polysaccharide export protein
MNSLTHSPCTPSWPAAFRALLQHRHVLMLQGPMGDFFSELAALMLARGQAVSKVHFNGGDQFFWHHGGALRYNGEPDALGPWLRRLIRSRGVDAVVLFGQMRPIHRVARAEARALGVEVFVFEEGYLRPDWVTIERRGVNALSRQPRLASFYRQQLDTAAPAPLPTGQNLRRTARVAAAYGIASALLKPLYFRQQHHRSLNPIVEPLRWLRGAWRQAVFAHRERGMLAPLTHEALYKRWFLVPLQVRDDSQVRDHSRFTSMLDFLDEVVTSFAAHAPADAVLVVKHHPMDRAYVDYAADIERLRQRFDLGDRLRYVHDLHLPTLLQHAGGVITVNSTVGLQALYHGTPVITLGESVYQVPGLVYDGDLATFWQAPGEVDRPLYERFRTHLIASSQLNASFYAERPALEPAFARAQDVRRMRSKAPDAVLPTPQPRPVVVAWSSARSATAVRGDERRGRPVSSVVSMSGRPLVESKAPLADDLREAQLLDA